MSGFPHWVESDFAIYSLSSFSVSLPEGTKMKCIVEINLIKSQKLRLV